MAKSDITLHQGRSSGRRHNFVLILESDRPIGALIAEWLEMAGYESMQVRDATAAKVAPECDVVLADVRAPLRSARETVESLMATVPHTPIIAMSADALASGPSAADAVARELGVAAVLAKPFGREALMQAIERVRSRT